MAPVTEYVITGPVAVVLVAVLHAPLLALVAWAKWTEETYD